MTDLKLGLSVTSLALVSVCSYPALSHLIVRVVKAQDYVAVKKAARYQDNDGTATQESEKACACRWQLGLLLLSSSIGALTSLMFAITASPQVVSVANWLEFATWVLSYLLEYGLTADVSTVSLSRSRHSRFHRVQLCATIPTKCVRRILQYGPLLYGYD